MTDEINKIILSILIDILGEPKTPDPFFEREWWEFNCPSSICRNDFNKFNLGYNMKTNTYHCWKCKKIVGTKGYVDKLIKEYGRKEHIDRFDLVVPKNSFNHINIFNRPQINHNLLTCSLPPNYIPLLKKQNTENYKIAYEYVFGERKLTINQVDKFKIGYTEMGPFAHRIIIPSFNQLKKINYFEARTYLKNVKPPYMKPNDPDKELIIFNEYYINWDLPVYLVEGPFDSVRIPNSIPMLGKAPSDLLLKKILEHNATIILCLDEDAFYDSIEIFEQLRSLGINVYFVDLKKKGDISKIYETEGQEGIAKILSTRKKIDLLIK